MTNCNRCGLSIVWREINGKWIPENQQGQDHRETCSGVERRQQVVARDRNHERRVHEFLSQKVKR